MPIGTQVQENLGVARALPQAQIDGADFKARGSRYGDASVEVRGVKQHALADEGAYFMAANPTAGTGIAANSLNAFTQTSPFLVVVNTSPAVGGASKRIYIDALRILVTVAAQTGATKFGMILDGINRWASGGTAITPVNCNMDDATGAPCNIYAGAITSPAASSNNRIVDQGQYRSVIAVVGDQYEHSFGGTESGLNSIATAGTAIAQVQVNSPPLVIGPGQSFALFIWAVTAGTANSYEFNLQFHAR